jgi:hypothetical protein
MSLYESKRSKSIGARGDASLFTVARTTDQLETTTEDEDNEEDITRPVRSCVSNPSQPQLTEESLLQLEQSLPGYRLAQRNLDRWFFYIQSTFLDTFETFRNIPDPDYYPACFDSPKSTVPLSQADFQESHHSITGSSDLFNFRARSPQEIQVVIPSRSQSTIHCPRISLSTESVESAAEAGIAEPPQPLEPSITSPVATSPEPPVPSTLARAESSSSSDYQQPVPSRRSRPRNTSSTSRLASPLALCRRITRSRSCHIRRSPQPISPSAEVISLSDSSDNV